MPQTSPMNWIIPFILSSTILTICFINIFNTHHPTKNNKNFFKKSPSNYKW